LGVQFTVQASVTVADAFSKVSAEAGPADVAEADATVKLFAPSEYEGAEPELPDEDPVGLIETFHIPFVGTVSQEA
jgi:hypothetical protein